LRKVGELNTQILEDPSRRGLGQFPVWTAGAHGLKYRDANLVPLRFLKLTLDGFLKRAQPEESCHFVAHDKRLILVNNFHARGDITLATIVRREWFVANRFDNNGRRTRGSRILRAVAFEIKTRRVRLQGSPEVNLDEEPVAEIVR